MRSRYLHVSLFLRALIFAHRYIHSLKTTRSLAREINQIISLIAIYRPYGGERVLSGSIYHNEKYEINEKYEDTYQLIIRYITC